MTQIDGTAGADVLVGTAGDDTINGKSGDDSIDGGDGFNTAVFSGNASQYTVAAVGFDLSVVGPDGHDTLTNIQRLQFGDGVALLGTRSGELSFNPAEKTIFALDGDDDISYSVLPAGNIFIDGGVGTDDLDVPGKYTDYTVSFSGGDTILSNGTTTFTLRNMEHVMFTGSNSLSFDIGTAGNDTLTEFGGPRGFIGGLGNDSLTGFSTGNEALFSGSVTAYTFTDNHNGSFTVAGPDGSDTITNINELIFADGTAEIGSAGGDNMVGTGSHSVLIGAGGGDLLFGTNGNDVLLGGDGDDTLNGGAGNDIIDGGNGNDVAEIPANFSQANFTFNQNGSLTVATASGGTDTLTSIEYLDLLDGTALVGTTGNDNLGTSGIFRYALGGLGNDTFTVVTNAGPMSLDGGPGTDTAILPGSYLNYTISNITTDTATGPSGSYSRTKAQATNGSFGPFAANLSDIEVVQFDDAVASLSNGAFTYLHFAPRLQNISDQSVASGKQITLAGTAAVQDSDDTNLQGATIQITAGRQTGDSLSAITAGTSITANYNASTGVLTLSGTDTLSHYQSVLRSVQFTAGTTLGNRTLQWQISDDDPSVNTASASATIRVVKPPPQDFNGDAKSDILFQNNDGTVAIWLMNGGTPTGGSGIGNPGAAWHVKGTGDFNGDGKADILFQNEDGTVAVWLMNGTSVIGGSGIGAPGPAWKVAGAGDFNGDGKADVLLQNLDGTTAVWLMNGATVTGGNPVGNLGSAWRVKAIADLNGDGKADIIYQSDSGAIQFSFMNGASVASTTSYNAPYARIAAVGDFDGDGDPDLLTRDADGTYGLITTDGGMLLGNVPVNPALNDLADGFVIGPTVDLNGDAQADVIAQTADGQLGALLISGNLGTALSPGNPGSIWHLVGNKGNPRRTLSDLDGNGNADILYQNTDGTIAVWLMNGSDVVGGGGIGNPGAAWSAKATGDFNGDGKADILYQNSDGTVALWLMNGLGVAGGGGIGNPGVSWHAVAAGDFNGDDKSDILYQNTDGTVAIWFMNGTSVTGGGGIGNTGTSWHATAAGDFNGDGKSDIVYQNDDGTVAIWLMNGSSVAGGSGVGNPGTAWHLKAAADFDGDGKADLLFQNNNGQAAIWLMNGLAVTGGSAIGSPGAGWQVGAAGSYNNDGRADILWQSNSGQSEVWVMNGLTQTSAAVVGVPGPSWHAVSGAG